LKLFVMASSFVRLKLVLARGGAEDTYYQ
jgi:hypothetical protein